MLIFFAACTAAFTGFLALSLAMNRHFRSVFAVSEPTFRQCVGLRVAGWFLIALAAFACVAVWGLSVGLVALFGVLTICALAVALMLTYLPWAMIRTYWGSSW